MLVLQRKPGQEVKIGEDVTVRVLKTSGNRVTIGIEAPDGVTIRRLELPLSSPAPNVSAGKQLRDTATDIVCL
ncbi:carbon storage regulator [Calycomorphotria hydatis]|uniref:Translational regulator CsrA n=1 Tax=Calycomorphotria hydatis TaxID=2528027 RepID=A0A517T3F5_9PLAN|nr:carbon storage regulator [Calycomorphotria hydatis]QDT62913.1 hypothetical protein V22_01110 [Calycomorphotria hydatis]